MPVFVVTEQLLDASPTSRFTMIISRLMGCSFQTRLKRNIAINLVTGVDTEDANEHHL